MQEELNNLKLAQSESKEYIISSLDETEIIYYISRIMVNQGELKSLSFSGVTDREIYVSGDLGLKFETNYNELKKIIEKFENGEYFTTLNNVRIDKKEKEESSNEETNEEREKTNKNTLDVDCGIRFYAKEANWMEPGDYILWKESLVNLIYSNKIIHGEQEEENLLFFNVLLVQISIFTK